MFGPLKKQSRLGQWNGRRRSSRGDEPMLPQVWQRPVLLRLAVVLVTTAAVTSLAYAWGPPLPYRVGETCPHDLRVRAAFDLVSHMTVANQPPAGDNAPDGGGGQPAAKRPDPAGRETVRYSARPKLFQLP